MEHFIYLLRIKAQVYKFGITNDTVRRFAEHKVTLAFEESINIWKVLGEPKARIVERDVKKWLAENNMLVNYLDNTNHFQTEIFVSDDVGIVVNFINNAIGNDVAEKTHIVKKSNFTCKKCGKKFLDARGIERHENRKRKCIVAVVDKENADTQCVFCGNIFSKKSNLRRHLGVCEARKNNKAVVVEDDIEKIKMELEVMKKLYREAMTENAEKTLKLQKMMKKLELMGVDIDD